jgi:hypothetical protein
LIATFTLFSLLILINRCAAASSIVD